MDNINLENEFYDEIFDYVTEVIVGIETKLYKVSEDQKEFREKLKTKDGMAVGSNTLENYLNQVYRGLVDKNDEFVLSQFQQFAKHSKVNPVFILNIISCSIMNTYPKFNRSKLNTFDFDTYIESVRNNISTMKKYYVSLIDKDFKKLNEIKPVEKNDK